MGEEREGENCGDGIGSLKSSGAVGKFLGARSAGSLGLLTGVGLAADGEAGVDHVAGRVHDEAGSRAVGVQEGRPQSLLCSSAALSERVQGVVDSRGREEWERDLGGGLGGVRITGVGLHGDDVVGGGRPRAVPLGGGARAEVRGGGPSGGRVVGGRGVEVVGWFEGEEGGEERTGGWEDDRGPGLHLHLGGGEGEVSGCGWSGGGAVPVVGGG